jgi:hypothetical protein
MDLLYQSRMMMMMMMMSGRGRRSVELLVE